MKKARDGIFVGALLVASAGFASAWLPLGLIFPGVFLLVILTYEQFTKGAADAEPVDSET